jgi:hypothetical protein
VVSSGRDSAMGTQGAEQRVGQVCKRVLTFARTPPLPLPSAPTCNRSPCRLNDKRLRSRRERRPRGARETVLLDSESPSRHHSIGSLFSAETPLCPATHTHTHLHLFVHCITTDIDSSHTPHAALGCAAAWARVSNCIRSGSCHLPCPPLLPSSSHLGGSCCRGARGENEAAGSEAS